MNHIALMLSAGRRIGLLECMRTHLKVLGGLASSIALE
jgi:hypothetical protein